MPTRGASGSSSSSHPAAAGGDVVARPRKHSLDPDMAATLTLDDGDRDRARGIAALAVARRDGRSGARGGSGYGGGGYGSYGASGHGGGYGGSRSDEDGAVGASVSEPRGGFLDHGDDGSSRLATAVRQQYLTPLFPSGCIFKFVLLTTWGDTHYVGLNGLELYDDSGDRVRSTESVPPALSCASSNTVLCVCADIDR
jgi:hypothetical protein